MVWCGMVVWCVLVVGGKVVFVDYECWQMVRGWLVGRKSSDRWVDGREDGLVIE